MFSFSLSHSHSLSPSLFLYLCISFRISRSVRYEYNKYDFSESAVCKLLLICKSVFGGASYEMFTNSNNEQKRLFNSCCGLIFIDFTLICNAYCLFDCAQAHVLICSTFSAFCCYPVGCTLFFVAEIEDSQPIRNLCQINCENVMRFFI